MTDHVTQHLVQPTDLFQLHFLHSAALAPDGQRVAYSVASHDATDDADYEQLWLLDIASGAIRQLTFGKQRNHSPQWSPDGKTLAFTSTRNEKAQL
jgi:Tol biopolymer transport system component